MAHRYYINDGQTISEPMGWDWDGAQLAFLFFDPSGDPATVTGMPLVYRSLYDSGDSWQLVEPFKNNDWRANGPISRFRVDLTGVSGYDSYQVLIWRTDDPMTLIPDGAFTGMRAMCVQPYTETNVKLGAQHYFRVSRSAGNTPPNLLAAGAAWKIRVQTGVTPVTVKLREMHYRAEELRLELFRNPTGVAGGTNVVVRNFNTVNPLPTQVVVTDNVTTTTNGSSFDNPEFFYGSTAAGQRAGGSIPAGRERILDPSTDYLVVITNTGTGDAAVQYFLDWYEGELDLPLGV